MPVLGRASCMGSFCVFVLYNFHGERTTNDGFQLTSSWAWSEVRTRRPRCLCCLGSVGGHAMQSRDFVFKTWAVMAIFYC